MLVSIQANSFSETSQQAAIESAFVAGLMSERFTIQIETPIGKSEHGLLEAQIKISPRYETFHVLNSIVLRELAIKFAQGCLTDNAFMIFAPDYKISYTTNAVKCVRSEDSGTVGIQPVGGGANPTRTL